MVEPFSELRELERPMPSVGKAVTRARLYDAVYQKVGLSRSESSALVELVLKEIADSVARGEAVKLSSFGSFTVRRKGPRIGRNPKTGVDVPISSRRVVVFKASAVMKQRINGEGVVPLDRI
jgi:integration host factor subunit alpha